MAVRQLQEMGDNLQLIMKRLTSNQKLLKLLSGDTFSRA